MTEQIILSIPHSSVCFPDKDGFNMDLLDAEVVLLTDFASDEIFHSSNLSSVKSVTSRIYCDVERLPDDEESMAKYGMGIIYTRTDDGKELRRISEAKKQEIIDRYYRPFHQKLTNIVTDKLQKYGECLIIDCHTFSDRPFLRDLDRTTPRPDICIGTDAFHTPPELAHRIIHFFESEDYTVKENSPYAGCIIPQEYRQKNPSVHSVMVEVNRKLYMDNNKPDNKKVAILNAIMQELCKIL